MTDIVKQLRSPKVFVSDGKMSSPVARAGAAEIERLREALRNIRDLCYDAVYSDLPHREAFEEIEELVVNALPQDAKL